MSSANPILGSLIFALGGFAGAVCFEEFKQLCVGHMCYFAMFRVALQCFARDAYRRDRLPAAPAPHFLR